MTTSLTGGGRALNAIWENQRLSQGEKIFLLYLSSRADFTGNFMEPRFESLARICSATGLSRSHALRIARRLEDGVNDDGLPVEHGGGYLKRQQRKQDGINLPSFYSLSQKIFDEYAIALTIRENRGGVVSERDYPVPERDGGSPCAGRGVVPERDPSSLRESSLKSSLTILPGAKAPPKKGKKKDSPASEAIRIGHLLFIPVDRGETRRRFVDLVALDAMLEEQYEKHGIEVFRHLRGEEERGGSLGTLVFDPNRIGVIFEKAAARLKNQFEEQAVQ